MNWLKFGLQALPGLIQGITGWRQRRNSRKIKLPDRPDYEIPEALHQRLGLDKMQLNSQMPGTSYFQNQIGANAAGMRSAAERNSTDANQNLLMAAAANQMSNKAQSSLQGKQAQYRALQEGQYKDSLTAMANEQKAAWKWNVGDAYQQEYDMALAMKNNLMSSGRKNQWAGVNNLLSAGVDLGVDNDWWEKSETTNNFSDEQAKNFLAYVDRQQRLQEGQGILY
jgi:hypothetical protein